MAAAQRVRAGDSARPHARRRSASALCAAAVRRAMHLGSSPPTAPSLVSQSRAGISLRQIGAGREKYNSSDQHEDRRSFESFRLCSAQDWRSAKDWHLSFANLNPRSHQLPLARLDLYFCLRSRPRNCRMAPSEERGRKIPHMTHAPRGERG
jgi:hypothetical protein